MTVPQVSDPLVVVAPLLTVLAVAGLGMVCATSLVAEESVCKDCISVFAAARDTLASYQLMAYLLS